jgi:hypothetical protein
MEIDLLVAVAGTAAQPKTLSAAPTPFANLGSSAVLGRKHYLARVVGEHNVRHD